MFVEPPVILCVPKVKFCNCPASNSASKIVLFPPPFTTELPAKHTLFFPPPITLPLTILPALGILDGAGDGLSLEVCRMGIYLERLARLDDDIHVYVSLCDLVTVSA